MAAPEEKGVASFPDPPTSLYELYTDENVSTGRAPKPPVPVKGNYHMFGAPFCTEDAMIRPLEEQGLEQLYPKNCDRKAELKKLNRSILICFLELLDILISNPASPAVRKPPEQLFKISMEKERDVQRDLKIKDISVLFINMHHLINEYRPHQARETLCVIMERQKKEREEMTAQVKRATDKARSILKECNDNLAQAVASLPPSDPTRQGRTSSEEAMDSSGPPAKKVPSQLPGAETSSSLVNTQDAELCALIDQLIGT